MNNENENGCLVSAWASMAASIAGKTGERGENISGIF